MYREDWGLVLVERDLIESRGGDCGWGEEEEGEG